MNDYLNVIRNNYANFEGRARRQEYWMFQLFNFIVIAVLEVLSMISLALGTLGVDNNRGMNAGLVFSFIFTGLLLIYALGILVPTIAITVRHLHDAGYSGWLYLVSLTGFGGIVIFIFTVLDSQPGADKWGPNPKGLQAPAKAF